MGKRKSTTASAASGAATKKARTADVDPPVVGNWVQTKIGEKELASAEKIGLCRWILCRKNMGYHATDPKIRTQGAKHVRSWIATKHGD
jgi:hypothetical protein